MLLLSTFLLGEDHGPIWRIFGICKHLRCEEVKCQYVANRHEKQDWDEALSLKTRRSPPTLSLLRFPRDGLARPAKPPHLPDPLHCCAHVRTHSAACVQAQSPPPRSHPEPYYLGSCAGACLRPHSPVRWFLEHLRGTRCYRCCSSPLRILAPHLWNERNEWREDLRADGRSK